jgi:hypothetical protein
MIDDNDGDDYSDDDDNLHLSICICEDKTLDALLNMDNSVQSSSQCKS